MDTTRPSREAAGTASRGSIVVAGDVCIDWLAFSVPPLDGGGSEAEPNFRLYGGTRMVARHGGALLLSRLVGLATGFEPITHTLDAIDDVEKIPPERVVHSNLELKRFSHSRAERGEPRVYRVENYKGFAGPVVGVPGSLPVTNDDANADVVVVDDAGNGFCDAEDSWPAALVTEGKKPIVIFKKSRPLTRGKLWEALETSHADRLVVVVNADDLRAEGLNISERLSWERTATDFVSQIASRVSGSRSDHLWLANCANLVVRFGIEGAVHRWKDRDGVLARLYYSPTAVEGDFRDDPPGAMPGSFSVFVAALTARVAAEGLGSVGEGVRDGLSSSWRLLRRGFGDGSGPEDPGPEVFEAAELEELPIADVLVPQAGAEASEESVAAWSIMRTLREHELEGVAYELVTQGRSPELGRVPLARFGSLRTVDRNEIESLNSIKNLIREYVARPKETRPLPIAVFGPPGAGKSFAVTEVATSASEDVEPLEFNLAQFSSRTDLVHAFHDVRDVALEAQIPLVFFDEFDSAFEGELGWLKHFLSPIQDGKFRDGEALHPTGRAIFVFAGGTRPTFAEFSRESADEDEKEAFRNVKGPDFVSRLRGCLDVLGPNPTGGDDHFFVIRRATLLRSMLERKTSDIIDSAGKAHIDEGVTRAFLRVPQYKHGARSMEAIIGMSMLSGRKRFEKSSLPPAKQLEMHVDAERFSRLVLGDLRAEREQIGKAIQEKYRRDHAHERAPDDPAMPPWEELSEELKEGNRRQADHIPEKLRAIRCGYAPVRGREPTTLIEFTDEEVELLAEMEHDRFVSERLNAGWTRGPERDHARKLSPYLVPWSELPTEVKEYDRTTVRGMPEFLADAGFEIYRFE